MLRPADFTELERQTASFSTKNHHRFLSEVVACLRRSRDPVAALELLIRMQDGASEEETAALYDVGTWLFSQLRSRTRDVADLELRLAWARRLARIAEARSRNARGDRGDKHRNTPRQRLRVTEQDLRQLRQRYPQPASLPDAPLPPQIQPGAANATAAARPPLPPWLAVMFHDHRKAMDTLKRLSSLAPARPGVPPRLPAPIPLVPAPGARSFVQELGPVALVCTATGIDAYLKELRTTHHGSAFPFYVAALEYDDDGKRVLARKVLLAPPAQDTDPPIRD